VYLILDYGKPSN